MLAVSNHLTSCPIPTALSVRSISLLNSSASKPRPCLDGGAKPDRCQQHCNQQQGSTLHHRRSGRRTGTLQRCAAVGDDWDDLWSEDLSDTSWGAPPPDPAPRTGSRSRSGSGGAAAADTFPEFEVRYRLQQWRNFCRTEPCSLGKTLMMPECCMACDHTPIYAKTESDVTDDMCSDCDTKLQRACVIVTLFCCQIARSHELSKYWRHHYGGSGQALI